MMHACVFSSFLSLIVEKIIAPVVLLYCKAMLAGCFLYKWANTEKER